MMYKDYDKQYLKNRVLFHLTACEGVSVLNQKSIGTLNTDSMFISDSSIKKIEDLLKELETTIENKRNEILNNFQKVIEDNNTFKRDIKNTIIQSGISVTSYQYRDDFLLSMKRSIETIIDELLSHTQDININTKLKEIEKNPLYSGRSQTEQYILQKLLDKVPNSWKSEIQKIINGDNKKKKNTNASTILEMFHYIRDTYHGKKENITISEDMIEIYRSKLDVINSISTDMESRFKKLLSVIKKEESNIKSSFATNTINPEQQSRFTKFTDSLSALVNFYLSFYDYYQDLRIEENFTTKAILSKIYSK